MRERETRLRSRAMSSKWRGICRGASLRSALVDQNGGSEIRFLPGTHLFGRGCNVARSLSHVSVVVVVVVAILQSVAALRGDIFIASLAA